MKKTLQEQANELCKVRKQKLENIRKEEESALENCDEAFQKYAYYIMRIFEVSNSAECENIYHVKIRRFRSKSTSKAGIESYVCFRKQPHNEVLSSDAFYNSDETEILAKHHASNIIEYLTKLDEMKYYYAEASFQKLAEIFKQLDNFEVSTVNLYQDLIISLNVFE